ncbi:hypothetical protein K1T71_014384 [Dendrolimus kikuchii]|uniref:Uncharacterized protein n=1 Tax=Dendrolimus kikuchii TaxID=765133 RepID=A0ACC1CDY3_9NEOP|nr:hypothetical protein K1T71_014384 [Dendrolimus kikuchii]
MLLKPGLSVSPFGNRDSLTTVLFSMMRVSDAEDITQTTDATVPSSNAESSSDKNASPVAPACEAEVITQPSGDSVPSGNTEFISDASAEPMTPTSEEEVLTQSTAVPFSDSESSSDENTAPAAAASEVEVMTQSSSDSSVSDTPEPTSDASASFVTPASEGEATTQPTSEYYDHIDNEESVEALVVQNTQSVDVEKLLQCITLEMKRSSKDKLKMESALKFPITEIMYMEQTIQQQAENIKRLETTTTKIIDITEPQTMSPPITVQSNSGTSASFKVTVSETEVNIKPTTDSVPSSNAESSSDKNASPVAPACEAEVITQPSGDSMPSGNTEFISDARAEPEIPACEEEVLTQSTAVPSGNTEFISDASAEPVTPTSEEEVLTQSTAVPFSDSESSSDENTAPAVAASEAEVMTQSSSDSSVSDTPEPTSDASASFVTPASEGEATTQLTSEYYDHDDNEESVEALVVQNTQSVDVEKRVQCITLEMKRSSKDKLKMESALKFLITKIIYMVQTIQQQAENIKRLETTTTKIIDIIEPQTMQLSGNTDSNSGATASSMTTISVTEVNNEPIADLPLSSNTDSNSGATASSITTASVTEVTVEPIADLSPPITVQSNSGTSASSKVTVSETEVNIKPTTDLTLSGNTDSNSGATDSSITMVSVAEVTVEPIADLSPSSTVESISSSPAFTMTTVSETGVTIERTPDLSPTITVQSNAGASASSMATVSETEVNIKPITDLSPSSTAESNFCSTASSIMTVSETGETIEPKADSLPTSNVESISDGSDYTTATYEKETFAQPSGDYQNDEDGESENGSVVQNNQSIDPNLVQYIIRELTKTINKKLTNIESYLEFLSEELFSVNQATNQLVNSIKDSEITKSQDIQNKDINIAKEEAYDSDDIREAQINQEDENEESEEESVVQNVQGIELNLVQYIIEKVNNAIQGKLINIETYLEFLRDQIILRIQWINRRINSITNWEIIKTEDIKHKDTNIAEEGALEITYVRKAQLMSPPSNVKFISSAPASTMTTVSETGVTIEPTPDLSPSSNVESISSAPASTMTTVSETGVPIERTPDYGTTLQLVDPRSAAHTETVDSHSQELLSEMNPLRFNNLPTQFDSEIVSYVFTEKPLEITQKIFIKILEVGKRRLGSLSIGVTSWNPKTLKSSKLPDDPEMLQYRPEHWEVCSDVVNDLVRDDELEVTMTVDREIQISRNGAPAFTVMHIYNLEPLWVFVHTYGATQQTRILARRQIISSFNSKTTKTLKDGNCNIIHGKCTSSMTPAFGAKATFQSPFKGLFNYETSPRSTFGDNKPIAGANASFTSDVLTANMSPSSNAKTNYDDDASTVTSASESTATAVADSCWRHTPYLHEESEYYSYDGKWYLAATRPAACSDTSEVRGSGFHIVKIVERINRKFTNRHEPV